MSALWPDHLLLGISPTHIGLMHVKGLPFKQRVIQQKLLELSPSSSVDEFQQMLSEGLNTTFQAISVKHALLTIYLASPLLQLSLMPPVQQALRGAEQEKRIQLHFERIYGATARQWCYQSHRLAFNTPTLAAGVNQSLLSAIKTVTQTHHLMLKTVSPYLIAVFNFWRNRLAGSSAWFVMCEPTTLTIMRIRMNHLCSLTQLPVVRPLNSQTLETQLKRESIKQNEPLHQEAVYLFAPRASSLSVESLTCTVHHLRLPEITSQPNHAMFLKLMESY